MTKERPSQQILPFPSFTPGTGQKLRVLITGANSGLGLESAWMLASMGARVVMACRNPAKAEAARAEVLAKAPGAEVDLVGLDLQSLRSIRACAEEVRGRYAQVDVLLNNAGVMALPWGVTEDGFERQFGTNHLGHFALTGLLWDHLSPEARVVNVSSGMHRAGRFRAEPVTEATYSRWLVYGDTKLANLLFTRELDRRIRAAGLARKALACHPGYASTGLQQTTADSYGSNPFGWMLRQITALFSQSAERGAWPSVQAAAGAAESGDYWGPGILDMWGAPVRCSSSSASRDMAAAARLWEMSERMTGVQWSLPA